MAQYGKINKRNWSGFFCTKNIIILLLCILVFGGFIAQNTKTGKAEFTVESITVQQNTSGTDGNVTTEYVYYVNTDNGTYNITPSGIMASKVFGKLKEGKRYKATTRGYSMPLVGEYPYIITAEEVN